MPLLRRVGIWLFTTGLLARAALAVEGDVAFKREAGVEDDTPPAVFSHWSHRIRYKCYVCHPAIFEMKVGANKITMDGIDGGKFCGTCHNGKISWESSFDTCNRCHLEREGGIGPPEKEEVVERKEPSKKAEGVGREEPTKKGKPLKKEERVEKKEPAMKEEQVKTGEPAVKK